MGTQRKIQKLLAQKKKAEKDIGEIQSKCRHSSQHIKFVHPNPISHRSELRWVCEECEKITRIPSKQEQEKFVRK